MAKMNIYVPDQLKERMDEVEGENWSRLASRAFESRLAEIITMQGSKTMNDVVSRLRASKYKTEDNAQTRGHGAGQTWAMNKADFEELRRLETVAKDGVGYLNWVEFLNSLDENEVFGPGHMVAAWILPGEKIDRDDGNEFWDGIIGDDRSNSASDRYSTPFVIGFVEGALTVWDGVKDRL